MFWKTLQRNDILLRVFLFYLFCLKSFFLFYVCMYFKDHKNFFQLRFINSFITRKLKHNLRLSKYFVYSFSFVAGKTQKRRNRMSLTLKLLVYIILGSLFIYFYYTFIQIRKNCFLISYSSTHTVKLITFKHTALALKKIGRK